MIDDLTAGVRSDASSFHSQKKRAVPPSQPPPAPERVRGEGGGLGRGRGAEAQKAKGRFEFNPIDEEAEERRKERIRRQEMEGMCCHVGGEQAQDGAISYTL